MGFRIVTLCLVLVLAIASPGATLDLSTPAARASEQAKFERWTKTYRRRALASGIRPEVFDTAFRGVRLNVQVIELDRKQSEISRQIWDYLDLAVSEARVRAGRAVFRNEKNLLSAIEARYGVDAKIVAAIWGIESAYGRVRGDVPVIEALATLTFEGRRGSFFESQLSAALRILQMGQVRVQDFNGSWAGAMGHTQFIPTSWFTFAVDWDGDGRRDIWSDDPADALASAAAYLKRSGWRKGQPWGVEVTLPRGFDYALADRRIMKRPSDWAKIGIRDTSGKAVRDYGRASILVPAGAGGAAFMIFDNFAVLERYNKADAYVIAVGHLGDRIAGGPPIRSDWPRRDRALANAEKVELQKRLTSAGHSTQGIDGVIGPRTIDAVREYQRAIGMIPDGYASVRLLERLR